jgi:sporulation protein YunB
LAKFRRRLSRRGPLPTRYVFLLTFVFFVFSTAVGLFIVNKGIEPTLMSYADSQTRKIASLVINNAVRSNVTNVKDIREIIETVPAGQDGEQSPSVRRFNAATITEILSETQNLVQKNLTRAEKGNISALEESANLDIEESDEQGEGIVYNIPLGQATNNALLGNLGPRIPVRFTPIGDVHTTIDTKVEEHGINFVWIEVYVKIKVNVQIIVPFATKITKMEQSIPVAMGLFEGEVPQFFNGGGDSSPSLELPINP